MEVDSDDKEPFLDIKPNEIDLTNVAENIKENVLNTLTKNKNLVLTETQTVISYQYIFYENIVKLLSGSTFVNDPLFTEIITQINSIKKNNTYLEESINILSNIESSIKSGILIRLERHPEFWDVELLDDENEKSLQVPFTKNLGLEIEKQLTYLSLIK